MNVGKILGDKGKDVIAMEQGCTVLEVSQLMGKRGIGAIPITDGGKLVGIMSERDVVRGISVRGASALGDCASTLMTKGVITCSDKETVYELMKTMTDNRIRHIPVLQEDALVGMVSIGDVVKHRLEEAAQEAEALKEYIAQA